MATFKTDTTLQLVTTKEGTPEPVQFAAGQTVTIVQTWDNFYLVKDDNGHYYNVRKEKIAE